jgi:hypothetical protein
VEDRLVAQLHPVASGRPHQAWLHHHLPGAVQKGQSRVHGLLTGQAPALIDAIDQHLAQRSGSITLVLRTGYQSQLRADGVSRPSLRPPTGPGSASPLAAWRAGLSQPTAHVMEISKRLRPVVPGDLGRGPGAHIDNDGPDTRAGTVRAEQPWRDWHKQPPAIIGEHVVDRAGDSRERRMN